MDATDEKRPVVRMMLQTCLHHRAAAAHAMANHRFAEATREMHAYFDLAGKMLALGLCKGSFDRLDRLIEDLEDKRGVKVVC